MRNSLRHCALVVIAAVSVTSLSTGCRSGGWSMPGSSWMSWGKKKPPASSIAGTHEPTQPPSIGIPPYPPDDSSSSSANSTAMSGFPSASQGDAPSGYGAPASGAAGLDNGVQTAAATSGYATGPYGMGGAGSATPQTQQGFYRTSTPDNGGPIASTADARGSYPPANSPSYGAGAPNSGYPAPPTGGAAPYGTEGLPPSGNYAPVTTPATNYGTPASAYPDTNSAPVTPMGANGAYPASAPATYGATPFPASSPTYADAPTYGTASQYGPYGGSPATGSAYGTPSSYGTSTGTAPGTASGYRPGSTSRNSSLLGPTSGTSTYSR